MTLECLSLTLVKSFAICLSAIVAVALFSVWERNVLSLHQIRLGPNKVGSLQPLADALNLLSNEESPLLMSYSFLYYLSPSLMMVSSLVMWGVFPSQWGMSSWNLSSFVLLLLFSLSVYGVIVLGWFSNSKYAVIGCVRSTIQSISYEVGLALGVIFLTLVYGSSNFDSWTSSQDGVWSFTWMPFVAVCFFLVLLVESNRSPFDLSEGESELVSGFCVEYGGVGYTVVFLSENLALLWLCLLMSQSFTGGSLVGFVLSIVFSVWTRASVPRVRFDHLISLFWVAVLPSLLFMTCLYLVLLV